jgi:multiple antibiotic resistance protein
MLETALIAFTTYFATIGPADVAALFAALTPTNTPAERRRMALKGTLIATAILLVFALFGEAVSPCSASRCRRCASQAASCFC